MKTIKFKDKELKVVIQDENEHLQKFWNGGNFYELKMLNYIHENYFKGLNFVDVGSCIGNHTLFFAGVMDANKVYSFEPVKRLLDIAEQVIELNGLDEKVQFYNIALSERKKSLTMELSNFGVNAGMSKISNSGNYKIQAVKLDSIKFDSIDVLKVDIENHNIEFLNGAKQTILTHKPDIFIEAQSDFEDVKNWLKNIDYQYTGLVFNATPTYLFKPDENSYF